MFEADDAVLGALAEARALGFLGPGPLEEHVASARRFALTMRAVEAEGPALDLGSGGGVPGLVLASWFRDWTWVLFDAQRRRTSFLAAAVARCGMGDHVTVVRGRAEEVGHLPAHRGQYGTVTARSFGPPPATAEAAAPLLRANGHLFVAEPPEAEDRWPAAPLRRIGLEPVDVADGVAVLEQVDECPPAFPRRIQSQRSDPLF